MATRKYLKKPSRRYEASKEDMMEDRAGMMKGKRPPMPHMGSGGMVVKKGKRGC